MFLWKDVGAALSPQIQEVSRKYTETKTILAEVSLECCVILFIF